MNLRLLLCVISITCFMAVSAQKPVRKGVRPIQKEYVPATAKYHIGQLNGKWQEVKRTSGDKSIDFTDSLQIHIKGNNAELREGNSMNMYMKGQARISAPNALEIAGDTYTIISLSGNQLLIDDGEFKRKLQKTNRFYYETLGKDEVKAEEFTKPIIADPASLKGKWVVYRRQAAPGYIQANTILIKAIDIRSDSISRYAVGDISFYQKDLTQSQPVRISFEGNDLMIHSKDQQWRVYLYKASDNELVFGKAGEVVYYAKPL